MRVKLQECLDYFLGSATLTRLLVGFYEKYRSFGTVRGSVQLRGLGDEGIEALEGLTGKNFHGKKSATVSAEKIQKCLDGSCYAGVTLDELVAQWNRGELKSKKQERQENEARYAVFFGQLVEAYEGTAGGQWLQEVLAEHGDEERILRKRFREIISSEIYHNSRSINYQDDQKNGQALQPDDLYDIKKSINVKKHLDCENTSRMEGEEKVFSHEAKVKSAVSETDMEGVLHREIEILMTAINSLPVWTDSYEYLPIFAAKVSGDPHYFDHKEKDTALFYYAIHHVLCPGTSLKMPIPAQERHELLLMAGIIVDPVSNDAMVYGLRAWAGEEEHMGLRGFCERGEPLSVTLSTIVKLDRVQCRGGQVYVVENPTVFAQLVESDTMMDSISETIVKKTDTSDDSEEVMMAKPTGNLTVYERIKAKDKANDEKIDNIAQKQFGKISVVCGNGQPNQAVLQLLDRIVRGNNTIYYNGDYDPEGLGIAQRLKDRYGERLVLWHYTEEDYRQALSDKPVSDGRMKMMEKLTSPELVRIAELIRETGRAGYQERVELLV